MNIHPVFVHFPVALLTIWSIAELVRLKKIQEFQWWIYMKAPFLFLGLLGAAGAYITGSIAEDLLQGNGGIHAIIETHQTWAILTILIYGIAGALTAIHFLYEKKILQTSVESKPQFNRVIEVALRAHKSILMPIIAVAGLIAITITGTLGGSIVYGANTDPIVILVYKILGL